MALFGRRRHASMGDGNVATSGFSRAAVAHGLEPVSGIVFEQDVENTVHETALVLHGTSPQTYSSTATTFRMSFHDAFRAVRDDRSIVVANGAINVNPGLVGTRFGTRTVSVCVVELPSTVALACVQPRRYRHQIFRHLPHTTTGNPAFDERFTVTIVRGLPPMELTSGMQLRLMARDDWIFRVQENHFICVSQDPFGSVDEMLQRIDDVLKIIAAIPTSALAARVDHSDDDLIRRISQLDSVEDAIAFLQHLTPADRERLAESDTPLAAFADVTTPEQAMQRFQALEPARRMQLLTMFENVKDHP